jgi:hypothetical protein
VTSEWPASRASIFRSKGNPAHCSWQKAKCLEHASDVIGQSCRHANELGSRTEKGARGGCRTI